MDIHRPDGTQVGKRRDFPEISRAEGPRFAEEYLRRHHERLIRRFETWL
ncbi:DUF7718 family protein [Haladaptatus cibarius]